MNKWQTEEKNLRPDALPVGGYDEYGFANHLNAIRRSKGRVATIISTMNVSTQL